MIEQDRSGLEWKGQERKGGERSGTEWIGQERNGQDRNGREWIKHKAWGCIEMVYNAQDSKVQESMPAGIISTAIITQVNDGIVKDFLSEEARAKWVRPEQAAIEVFAECNYNNEKFGDTRIFPYKNDETGKTLYSDKSNLGKYAKYYKKLPEVGDQVQMKTNADGFFKLVIE